MAAAEFPPTEARASSSMLVLTAAAFAVVCGVVLVVLTSMGGGQKSPAEQRRDAMLIELASAIDAVQRADVELDKQNYGEVRALNAAVREHLAAVQFDLEVGK